MTRILGLARRFGEPVAVGECQDGPPGSGPGPAGAAKSRVPACGRLRESDTSPAGTRTRSSLRDEKKASRTD